MATTPTLLTRAVRIADWPAPVLNGLTVGLGLACLSTLVGAVAGLPAAITAASGAATASVADTVCAPQVKHQQMRPAIASTLLVTALVAMTHGSPWALALVVVLVTFSAIFWMAWGKRGGPQTFVMVLTLVFQMAAFSHGSMDAQQAWRHLGWVALGAVGMAAWSSLSIRVLARRYRALALADSLDALAGVMLAQAQWTRQQALPDASAAPGALLPLIQRQAGVADVFQSARDLLYSQADQARCSALTHRQIEALVHTVNLRDVVQACQLDLDRLPEHPDSARVVAEVAAQLSLLAGLLQQSARAWRTGQPGGPLALPDKLHWPHQQAVLRSLGRRCQHMHTLVRLIVQAQPRLQATPGHAASPQAPTAKPPSPAILRTLVSPSQWTWPPLKAQLHWTSPVYRYAVRATLAVACADGLAQVLPWASHPHWILMTVAVVMRGNLEQTLARRDARVQGTLVGCLLASALITWAGHSVWLFLALALALSLAHGFVLINYRVTAAAGAVLALVQGHLFMPGDQAAWLDAAERLGDTLIGAGLAWAFSYVLPSWEGQQLPRLVQRLLQAQSHYAHQALRWHLEHPRAARRSLARREVYDVLWLLSQSLQRMAKEPSRAQAWAPALEAVLVHSNRLISHLAAIKGLLGTRHQALDMVRTGPALAQAERQMRQHLQGPQETTPAPKPSANAEAPEASQPTEGDAPAHGDSLDDWLRLRLTQTTEEARLLAQAARALTHPR